METNATTEPTQSSPKPRREKRPLNGVDVPTLFATINAVGEQPELAKFQFRASNKWVKGTHSRSRIEGFSGAGGEHAQTADFVYDADHPPVLCGAGNAPVPVEFLLHAIAGCITAGIGNIASARGSRARVGRVHGRGRPRRARSARTLGGRPQRLPGHSPELQGQGRRRRRDASQGRRAVASALRRVRRAHQRGSRVDRSGCRLMCRPTEHAGRSD